MRKWGIVACCVALGGGALALHSAIAAQAAAAESTSTLAWKSCQSTDKDKRLLGCTSVIDANGFGSPSKFADALDGRCWAYNAIQQFRKAIQDCTASIRIRPRYSYVYNNLGTAYLGLQNYQEALKALNIAVNLKPDFYWSRFNRAKALAALGQKESAAQDIQYLLKRDPTNQELSRSLEALAATGLRNTDAQPVDQTLINMANESGVYVVPARFNDMITLSAIVDSGASDVSVPADVVLTLMRTRTITEQDFLGQQTYVMADGSKVPSQQFRIRSLRVGDKTVEDVVASIASVNGGILLGQSFLKRFRSWSIDNEQHTLTLR